MTSFTKYLLLTCLLLATTLSTSRTLQSGRISLQDDKVLENGEANEIKDFFKVEVRDLSDDDDQRETFYREIAKLDANNLITIQPVEFKNSYVQKDEFDFEFEENKHFLGDKKLLLEMNRKSTEDVKRYRIRLDESQIERINIGRTLAESRITQETILDRNNSQIVKLMATWLPDFKTFLVLWSIFYGICFVLCLLLQLWLIFSWNRTLYRAILSIIFTSQLLTSLPLLMHIGRGIMSMIFDGILEGRGTIWALTTSETRQAYQYLERESLHNYFPLFIPSFLFLGLYLTLLALTFRKRNYYYVTNSRRLLVQCRVYPAIVQMALIFTVILHAEEEVSWWLILGAIFSVIMPLICLAEIIYIGLRTREENEETERGIRWDTKDMSERDGRKHDARVPEVREHHANNEVRAVQISEENELAANGVRKDTTEVAHVNKDRYSVKTLHFLVGLNHQVWPLIVLAFLIGPLVNFWYFQAPLIILAIIAMIALAIWQRFDFFYLNVIDLACLLVITVLICTLALIFDAPLWYLIIATIVTFLLILTTMVLRAVIFGLSFMRQRKTWEAMRDDKHSFKHRRVRQNHAEKKRQNSHEVVHKESVSN